MRGLPVLPFVLLLAACATPSATVPTPPASPTPAVSPVPSRAPVLNSSSGPASDAQNAAVEAARRDAAGRLSLPPESLQVEQVDARQWNDRALGCPTPGVLYAQIVTPGFLVVIGGGGRHLEYHTDDRGMAVFCQER